MKKCVLLLLVCVVTTGLMAVNNFKSMPPQNLSINLVDGIVTLGWDAVTGAGQYYIYTQVNPYTEFTLIDSTKLTTWNGSFTQDKQFFYVTTEIISVPEGFAYIQGGTFPMGDNFSEGNSDELPLHGVTISDFYIGKREVTQAEWEDFMPEKFYTYGAGDTYPVYYIRWYEIIKYCNLRSIAEGLTPCYTINGSTDPADWGTVPTSTNPTWDAVTCNFNAKGYRLPTEAEWEFAARSGLSGQRFPDGATISHDTNGDTQANYYSYWESGSPHYSYDVSPTEGLHPDYDIGTSPVASFSPNSNGLYDMSGNVWEWCWDWYSENYYSISPSSNPTGPATGTNRVKRGGNWPNNAYDCRVASRNSSLPYDNGSYDSIGFRLSRTF